MKTFRVKVNGKEYEVEVEEIGAAVGQIAAQSTTVAVPAQPAIASTPQNAVAMQSPLDGKICAPMPGTVLRVACSDNQTVKKGETLLILEAMKMENEIQAPTDGKVQEVKVAKGQSVDAGELLIQLA